MSYELRRRVAARALQAARRGGSPADIAQAVGCKNFRALLHNLKLWGRTDVIAVLTAQDGRARRQKVIRATRRAAASGTSIEALAESLGYASVPSLRVALYRWGALEELEALGVAIRDAEGAQVNRDHREQLAETGESERQQYVCSEVDFMAGWRSSEALANALGYGDVKALDQALRDWGRYDLAARVRKGPAGRVPQCTIPLHII